MKTIALGVLLAAVLVFGCVGGGPPQAGAQASAQQPADLAGKDFTELVALGVPAECDVKTFAEGQTINSKLYIKGENYRYEASVKDAQGTPRDILMIKDATKINVQLPEDAKKQLGCDWLYFETDMTTQAKGYGAMSSDDLKSIPKTDFSCKPGVFGDEKFAVTGKACSFKDMLAQAMGNSQQGTMVGVVTTGGVSDGGNAGAPTFSPATACNQITDPATKAECEKAMAKVTG